MACRRDDVTLVSLGLLSLYPSYLPGRCRQETCKMNFADKLWHEKRLSLVTVPLAYFIFASIQFGHIGALVSNRRVNQLYFWASVDIERL